MVDVGCGDGRYSFEISRRMGDKVTLHCVDSNEEMLKHLNSYMTSRNISNFQTHRATAEDLPFQDDFVDCVVTMNAIHHFKLPEFLSELSRIVINHGYVFIYT